MKSPVSFFLVSTCVLPLMFFSCANLRRSAEGETNSQPVIQYDDTRKTGWDPDFYVARIPSSKDGTVQNAYCYKAESGDKRPLVVSLHTWSGDYTQKDTLSVLCKINNLNYIHPDFRGPNWTTEACCSDLALSDIDDAIDYAIEHLNPDVSRIFVIGASGGGYATLATFMKSKHNIKMFSAWVPISDLKNWYIESVERQAPYAAHILKCTGSEENMLNGKEAEERSPMYWKTPTDKLMNASLHIYAGIFDGITGSVPVTHSINFYNKVLGDLQVKDKSRFVSTGEKNYLLHFRKPFADFGKIEDRNICLMKEYGNLRLIIFEGGHEMLPVYAFNSLMNN